MPRFGSASAWILVDGFDLSTSKLKGIGYKVAPVHEDDTGIGDTVRRSSPVGLSEITFQQRGGFFDTSANGGHAALKSPASAADAVKRIVTFGFAGQTLGNPFIGLEGTYQHEYEVLGQSGNLTKANAAYHVVGTRDEGVILHPLGSKTGPATGTGVDNTTSSAAGGAGYLQVTSYTGLTSADVKIQHSIDAAIWADLITFAQITGATPMPATSRLSVAGAVNRHLRYVVTIVGTGNIVFFTGFARG